MRSAFDIDVHPSMTAFLKLPATETDTYFRMSDVTTPNDSNWSEVQEGTKDNESLPVNKNYTPTYMDLGDEEPIAARLRSRDHPTAVVNTMSEESVPVQVNGWFEKREYDYYPMINKLNADNPDELTTAQAQKSPNWDSKWAPAAMKEFYTLDQNGTGHEVKFEDIPSGEPIFPSKMIFKQKRDPEGDATTEKGRLVVCANWIAGIFASLFAPTFNAKSMKLLFMLSIIFG